MECMVMIPTYNESENIGPLIDAIVDLRMGIHIVIVDDESPDGTGRIIDEYAARYPEVHPFHRQGPRGRGWAGIAGYRYALDAGAEMIIEMDADFSHQPKHLPEFISALRSSEVVIGSRFVKGGSDSRPGMMRHVISRTANFYQNLMLGVSLTDCTSGYRGYRNYVLEGIGVRQLNTWGPAILSDVLYRLHLKNYSITEIPIEFIDRERGQSTLTTRILLEGLWNVIRVRCSVKRRDLE